MTHSKLLIGTAAGVGTVLLVATGIGAVAQTAEPQQVAPAVETAHYSGHGGYGKRHGGRRGRAMMRMLRNADANNDGAVTQAEVDAYRAGLVADADADGDGNLTLEEFQTLWMAQMRQRMVRAFQRLDTDGDAIVTKAEQDAPFANIVERFDRNDDGKLDRDDRRDRWEGRHHRRGGDRGPRN